MFFPLDFVKGFCNNALIGEMTHFCKTLVHVLFFKQGECPDFFKDRISKF
jgi:hypothetical protein